MRFEASSTPLDLPCRTPTAYGVSYGAGAGLDPSRFLKPVVDAAQPCVAAAGRLFGCENLVTIWRELRNKTDVYHLVRSIEVRLGLERDGAKPLCELVERAYRQGQFAALWALEGLGRWHALHMWRTGGPPTHLLRDPARANLPRSSLTMLHAGIGQAFAKALLDDAARRRFDAGDCRDLVRRFVGLCARNSAPGYEGCAYEALGLVVRAFHPARDAIVRRALGAVRPDLIGSYWHGVGRALYFVPGNALPFLDRSWEEAAAGPDAEAAFAKTAGLALAVTQVNLLTPQVLRRMVRKLGPRLKDRDAFSAGVRTSLLLRWDTTPGAPFVTALLKEAAEGEGDAWRELVCEPGLRALRDEYPRLVREQQLGAVIRFDQRPSEGGARMR